MKANTRKLLIAGAAIAAVALGLTVILKKKRSNIPDNTINTDPTTSGTSSTNKVNGVLYPLKRGSGYSSSSEKVAVKNLQRNLNIKIGIKPYLGLAKLTVDGLFGPKTEAACQKILGVTQVSYSLYKELIAETPEGIKLS